MTVYLPLARLPFSERADKAAADATACLVAGGGVFKDKVPCFLPDARANLRHEGKTFGMQTFAQCHFPTIGIQLAAINEFKKRTSSCW